MDEVLVLAVRTDGCQSAGHLPVEGHHFMVEEGGDVKVLLQDLLSAAHVEEGERDQTFRWHQFFLELTS